MNHSRQAVATDLIEAAWSYKSFLYEIGQAGPGKGKDVVLRSAIRDNVGGNPPSHTAWAPGHDPRALKAADQLDNLEFEEIAEAELDEAIRHGAPRDKTDYQNTYVTKDGQELLSTRVAVYEGRIYYPKGETSGAMLNDVIQRTTDLLNHRQQLTAEEALKEFADIVHGYHQAMPFERGSDGVSQALVRGLYQAVTGEKMRSLKFIDVKAQLMSRESFERWFIEEIRNKHVEHEP